MGAISFLFCERDPKWRVDPGRSTPLTSHTYYIIIMLVYLWESERERPKKPLEAYSSGCWIRLYKTKKCVTPWNQIRKMFPNFLRWAGRRRFRCDKLLVDMIVCFLFLYCQTLHTRTFDNNLLVQLEFETNKRNKIDKKKKVGIWTRYYGIAGASLGDVP
jgi:hypothetical protein